MELVEARVRMALERSGYIGGNHLLVVAVSGGPDSLALLYSLLSLGKSSGLRFHLAHLDHNFRGEEAKEDARFVAALALQLGLPVTVGKSDPQDYQAEMKISSFEEAAREMRYNFLARVARVQSASAVALGHTADDLAETVLMHIIRGSGTKGLRGILELSTWTSRTDRKQAALFRPLLEVTKEETTTYCRTRGVGFREDTGNRLMHFTRNRVRHELLPLMRSYNPKVREALVRLARSSALEFDYLEKEVAKVWPDVATRRDSLIELDTRCLAELHPVMRHMVLRRAYEEVAGDTRRLEEVHLKAMVDFVDALPGRALSLPRGLRLYAGYGQLTLAQGSHALSFSPSLEGEHQLSLPSSEEERVAEIPGWHVSMRIVTLPASTSADPLAACFDLVAIGNRLRVRSRLAGDRFQPLGMQSEKKLQDFYVDEKVPRAWRDSIPLVVSQRRIAWVVGYRVAEWAKVKQDSQGICHIRFSRITS